MLLDMAGSRVFCTFTCIYGLSFADSEDFKISYVPTTGIYGSRAWRRLYIIASNSKAPRAE
jgi:hypothetical protein